MNIMKKQILVQAVVTAMLGMGATHTIAAQSVTASPSASTTLAMETDKNRCMGEAAKGMEKCYGIVRASKNDCGVPGANSCSAQVKQEGAPKAWIFVPKGTCDKIVGGSTKPKKSS